MSLTGVTMSKVLESKESNNASVAPGASMLLFDTNYFCLDRDDISGLELLRTLAQHPPLC